MVYRSGSGAATGADFDLLAADFGKSINNHSWYIDSNMDGAINGSDFANFVADDGHSDPVLSGQPGAILVGTLSNVIQGPEDTILGVVSRSFEENFYYSDQWQLI